MKPTELKTTKLNGRAPRIDPEMLDVPSTSRRSRSRGASVDFEDLSADLDKLTMPTGESRPNPVELPSPINPEGGRKQSVEMHRNLFCGNYDSCLDEAVKHGWNSFTCVRCTYYQATPEAGPGGVDRFATQRKAS